MVFFQTFLCLCKYVCAYICVFNNKSHKHAHSHRVDSKCSQISGFVYLLVCYVLFVTPSQSSVLSQSVTDSKHSQVPNMLQMFSRCFSFFGFFPCTEFNLLILIAVKTGKHCIVSSSLLHRPHFFSKLGEAAVCVLLCPLSVLPLLYYILYTASDWYSQYFDIPCHT